MEEPIADTRVGSTHGALPLTLSIFYDDMVHLRQYTFKSRSVVLELSTEQCVKIGSNSPDRDTALCHAVRGFLIFPNASALL